MADEKYVEQALKWSLTSEHQTAVWTRRLSVSKNGEPQGELQGGG